MSTYILTVLDNNIFSVQKSYNNNTISNYKNNKINSNDIKINTNYLINDDNNEMFPGSNFRPNKKVIVIEKEIIKEVVKEVCDNIQNNQINNNQINNNQDQSKQINNNQDQINQVNNSQDQSKQNNNYQDQSKQINTNQDQINQIDNNQNQINSKQDQINDNNQNLNNPINNNNNQLIKFKDERSLLNYFLTYQYYYQFENYQYKQYIDKEKYNDISYIQVPQVNQSDFNFPSIEYWNLEIAKLNQSYNIPSNVSIIEIDYKNIEYRDKYFNLVKKRAKALVCKQYYDAYNQQKMFHEFARANKFTFEPPRLQLPLNTSKPLLTTPYIFLHIAKAAGHTIFSHFNSHFRGVGVLRQWVYPNPTDQTKINRATNFILGHFEYGIHNEYNEELRSTHSYLTMLRDPVDRVISHYFYHRNTAYDAEHKLAIEHSLEEWIHLSVRSKNEQTRALGGMHDADTNISNETFNMALYHLRTMKFVGITEKMPESLALMYFFTGLESPRVQEKQNVGKKTNVSPEIIEEIKKMNWMDIILYEEALKIFERQIDLVGRDRFEQQLNKILGENPSTNKNIIIPKSNNQNIIPNQQLPFFNNQINNKY